MYYIILILLLILFLFFIIQDKKESFIDIHLLQKKTGRNYSECQIKCDNFKVKKINDYLKINYQKIPKIIHQIWIGPKKLPYKWINSFRKDFMNKYPGWKYYLWRDRDVKNFNLQNRLQYNSEKTYHGKSDILRYEILYNYGGI